MLIAIEMELTKVVQYLKILYKIKVNLDFSRSLTSQTGNLECACAHIFKKRFKNSAALNYWSRPL